MLWILKNKEEQKDEGFQLNFANDNNSSRNDDSDQECQAFDPNFILWRVYGYQNIHVKTPDGVFEIFEPVKIHDQHLISKNELESKMLSGYKESLDKSNTSDDILNEETTQKNSNMMMTPRSIIK